MFIIRARSSPKRGTLRLRKLRSFYDVALFGTVSSGTINLVQSADKVITGVNNTTLAFGSSVTAGNLLVVTQAHFQGTSSAITTPTDTLGHTYVGMTAQQQDGSTLVKLRSFYVANCSGGANTVTFDIAGAGTGEFAVAISEWNLAALTSVLFDTSVGGPTTGTAVSSGDVTPVAGALIYAATTNQTNNVSITPEGGWTTLEQNVPASSVSISVIYKIATDTTTEDADWTLGSSTSWIAHAGVFLPQELQQALYQKLLHMGVG